MTYHEPLIAVFLLGLFGSGHCLGMCGPLVLAFPGRSGRFLPHLAYHSGRIGCYSLVGMVLGFLGSVLDQGAENTLSSVSWIQVSVLLFAALFMLFLAATRLGFCSEPEWLDWVPLERLPGAEKVVATASRRGSLIPMMGCGFLFGLLPCGLSYGAFARALAASGPWHGALMTCAFGVGTLPALLLLGTSFSHWISRHRRASDLISGLLLLYMGVDLVLDALTVVW